MLLDVEGGRLTEVRVRIATAESQATANQGGAAEKLHLVTGVPARLLVPGLDGVCHGRSVQWGGRVGEEPLVRSSMYPRSAVASLLLALMLAAVAGAVLVRRSRALRIDPPSAGRTAESDDSTLDPKLPGDAASPTGARQETVTHDSDGEAPDLLPPPEYAEIAPSAVRVDDFSNLVEERETPPIPGAVDAMSAEEPPQGAEVGVGPQRSEAQAPSANSSSAPVVAGPGASAQRRTDLAAVRVWARANGYTVAVRGRIAAAVLVAYDQAH